MLQNLTYEGRDEPSLSMPGMMLSLSVLFLATYDILKLRRPRHFELIGDTPLVNFEQIDIHRLKKFGFILE